ncbi:esterase [Ligilactobacillus salitolerans]|uniref:Esterase n=1 Tax=Ligilactobacillus salitolerans TaxID=1808352 RepID=A0A401IU24_9LACO|nr:GDSL-type esterase/lipase family protein [Ligilactobacillus salitolerans]GBG95032.1 esterase [Ligilactobacillus salitolerans]
MRKRIVLFGDSITAGATHGHPTPVFSDKLRQALAPVAVELINRGVLGDNTEGGLARIVPDVLEHKPDIVVIFFGTNDVQVPGMTKEHYQANLTSMIQQIGAEKCILITPGITGPSRQEHRPLDLLKQYAQATVKTAEEQQVPVVDWFQEASRHEASTILQRDDLHYRPVAYDLLLEKLVPLVLQKLG